MIRQTRLLLFFSFFLFTCTKESDPIQAIDPSFQTYVDRFASEASLRGVNVNLQSLTTAYSDTLRYYCGYGIQNAICISTRPNCWANQNDSNREILFFHELGHAILRRSHDNSLLPNGDYKTMMFDGNQMNLYAEDTPERRKYYLDELFNQATPIPDWAKPKLNAFTILNDTISKKNNAWNFFKTSGSNQVGEVSSVALSSGSSLSIKASAPSAFSYWYYELTPSNIEQSSQLVLKVNMKLDQVTGEGAYFALKGDSDTKNIFFVTTQHNKKITGTTDFIEFSLQLPYYLEKTKKIYIFLMMDGTATGTVYFDNISLVKYN